MSNFRLAKIAVFLCFLSIAIIAIGIAGILLGMFLAFISPLIILTGLIMVIYFLAKDFSEESSSENERN